MLKAVLLLLLRGYRLSLAYFLGGRCRFHPSCSLYAEEAVRRHGAFRGALLAAWRVARCGPFGGSGFDPVPQLWHQAFSKMRSRHDDAQS